MYYETNYLSHHGVKGMKWGVRRYQNEDGSLTSAGKRRNKDLKRLEDNVNSKKKYYDSMAKNDSKGEARFNAKIDKRQAQANKSTGLRKVAAQDKADRARLEAAQAKRNRERSLSNAKSKVDYAQKTLDRKKASYERNESMTKKMDEIKSKASKTEKLLYNDAVFKKAATYANDYNMSMDDAMRTAKKKAWINTGASIVAIYAYTKL